MKAINLISINKTTKALALVVVFLAISCVPKFSNSTLKVVNFETNFIAEIDLPDSVNHMHQISGFENGDTVELFLTDMPRKNLIYIKVNSETQYSEVKKIPLDFMKRDRATFFSAGLANQDNQFVVVRDQRYSKFDYDSIYYFFNSKGFSTLNIQPNDRMFIINDGDSSKYTILHAFKKPCILNNDIYVQTVPTRISSTNKKLRQKHNIPDLLKISLINGAVQEIFDVIDFDNISKNYQSTTNSIYLTADHSKNKIYLTYGNNFNIYELDPVTLQTKKINHGISSSKYLSNENPSFLDSNLTNLLFNISPIYVKDTLAYFKLGFFSSEMKLSNEAYRSIYHKTKYGVFYDSNFKIQGLMHPFIDLKYMFASNGANYFAELVDGKKIRLQTVDFNISDQEVDFDAKIDELVNWVSNIEEVEPFNFSEIDIPKNAKVLLMPLANCPSCVRSTFEYIIQNKESFQDDFYFLFSYDAMGRFGMNPANYDLKHQNFKILSGSNYETLLPSDFNDFYVVQLKDGKVVGKEKFSPEMIE